MICMGPFSCVISWSWTAKLFTTFGGGEICCIPGTMQALVVCRAGGRSSSSLARPPQMLQSICQKLYYTPSARTVCRCWFFVVRCGFSSTVAGSCSCSLAFYTSFWKGTRILCDPGRSCLRPLFELFCVGYWIQMHLVNGQERSAPSHSLTEAY